ncbi:unnamed protein product [Schistosoma mattheei]|uniref:Ataxin-7-like protein 2 n=2 Tax=Schistosoma TaxID=6181 RepID=A0A183JPC4_9TREM|nr:unnamed protein product [Schistosoma curassoni]VDP70221.1 unnamed protein product [Schistosoma mattheei]
MCRPKVKHTPSTAKMHRKLPSATSQPQPPFGAGSRKK